MKVLFDNGTPKPIARNLAGHTVSYAREIGWHELGNGELIQMAEDAGYEVLVSTDKNIRYQQNLANRKIAPVVLGNSLWPIVRLYLDRIVAAINVCKPGSYTEVDTPFGCHLPSLAKLSLAPMHVRMAVQFSAKPVTMRVNQVGPPQQVGIRQDLGRTPFRHQLAAIEHVAAVGDIF